jgi:hypothetical protein
MGKGSYMMNKCDYHEELSIREMRWRAWGYRVWRLLRDVAPTEWKKAEA